jgi:ABC-2 type transport system ATP-binding protein
MRRLGIAAALLGDPPVPIFDEPYNGMTPGHRLDEGLPEIAGGAGPRGPGVQHLMSELEVAPLVIVGRGRVIADTSVADLIAAASGDRITVRTTARAQAMTALANAGAEVATTGPGTLTISNLSADKAVAVLTAHAVPFSEVTAHRATLEQAYMELTHASVEFRAEETS